MDQKFLKQCLILFYESNNEILFYDWANNVEFCLPKGSTSATIRNDKFLFDWNNIDNNLYNNNDLNRIKRFLNQNFKFNFLPDDSQLLVKKMDDENTILLFDTQHTGGDIKIGSIKRENINSKKAIFRLSSSEDHDDGLVDINNEFEFILNKEFGDIVTVCEKGNKYDNFIFTWEDIDTNDKDQNKLKDFILKHSNALNWLNTLNSKFEFLSDKILMISTNGNNDAAYITINDDNTRAILSFNNNNVNDNNSKKNNTILYEFIVKNEDGKLKIFALNLNAGDVLIFEEIYSPTTLKKSDASYLHRQAVRLLSVKPNFDNLFKIPLLEIAWMPEDALQLPLCVNISIDANDIKNNNNNQYHDSNDINTYHFESCLRKP